MTPRPRSWRDVAKVSPNRPRYAPGGLGKYRSSNVRSRSSGGRQRDDTDELLNKLRDVGSKKDDGGFIDKLANVGKKTLGGVFDAIDTPRAAVVATISEFEDAIGATPDGDGFSVSDIIEKTRRNISASELAGVQAQKELSGTGAGLASALTLDIGLDPIAYVAPQTKLDDVLSVSRKLDAAGDAGAAARVLKARTASVLTSEELAKIGAKGGIYTRVPGTGAVGRTLGVDRLLKKAGVTDETLREGKQIVSRESRTGRAAAAASRAAHKPIAGALNARPSQQLVKWGFAGGKPQLKAMLRSGDPELATRALWGVTKEAEGRYVAHGFESRHGKALAELMKDAKKQGVEGRDLFLAPTGDPDAVLKVGPELTNRIRQWYDDAGIDANRSAGSEFLNIHEDYTARFVQDDVLDAIRRGDERTVESIVKKRKYGTGAGEQAEFMGHPLVSRNEHPKGWSVERQIDGILYEESITSSPRKSGFYKDDGYEVMPLYLKKLSKQVGREYTGTELKKVGVGADLYKEMRGPRRVQDTARRLDTERQLSMARRARNAAESTDNESISALSEWAARLDEAADNHTANVQRWLSGGEMTSTELRLAQATAEQASSELTELIARHSKLVQHRDSILGKIEDLYDDAAAKGIQPNDAKLDELRSQLDSAEGLLDDLNATVNGIDLNAETTLLQQIQQNLLAVEGLPEQEAIGQALSAAQQSKVRAATELVDDSGSRTALNLARQERGEILDDLEAPLNDVRSTLNESEQSVLDTSVGGEPLTPAEADIRARFQASTDPEEQVDLGIQGQIVRLEAQADQAAADLGKPMDGKKAVEVLSKNETTVRNVLARGYRQFGSNTQLPEHIVESLTAAGRLAEPEGLSGALRLYDKVQNLWKAYAVATPGFHFRNSFGGVFNNYLAGVSDAKAYARYPMLARAAEKGTLDKLDPALVRGWEEMQRLGVAGTGQTAYEIETRLFQPLSVNPASTDFAPLRASRRIGEGVENNLRGTLFLDEYLRNGEDATEAFAKVMKFHFDYEDLSAVERSVTRRLIPFYTWTRRNLPLQLEMLAKQPAKMNRYWTFKRNIEATSEEEGVVPPYYEDLWAIRLPFGKSAESGGSGQMYLTPDLPVTQLGEAFDPGMAIGNVTPILKTPIEYWSGKQFFKDLPISDDYEPAPAVFTYVPGLMEGMKLLGRAERSSDGQWMLKERDAYGIGQFLPLMAQARRVLPSEDSYEDRRWSSMLSYFFGVGTRTNTKAEQDKVLWRRYYELDDQIKEAEQLGQLDPEENITVNDILETQ
jgi:hypothetical protein